jgi:hypothetical protein
MSSGRHVIRQVGPSEPAGPATTGLRAVLGNPVVVAFQLAIAGAAVGAVMAQHPLPGLLSLVALSIVCFAVWFRQALPEIFLRVLLVVLAGYALFGRSFAYIGVPPLYIGELTMGLGVLAAAASGAIVLVASSPITWLIAAFATWGALRTAPYLATFGVDALRDAVLWGYGGLALMVAACVLRTGALSSIVTGYGRWILPLAAWSPAVLLLSRLLGASAPNMPGTDLPLFSAKSGDFGVHLAGAATFLLLGLGRAASSRSGVRLRSAAFWSLWLVSMLFVASLNRGGFLSVLTALSIVALMRPFTIGTKIVFGMTAVVLAAIAVVTLSALLNDSSRPDTEIEGRSISPRQVVDNVLSISGGDAPGDLSNTRTWRLDWWRSILDYTFFGEYFWKGKGFGLNLADDDGFQVSLPDEAPLRSPHNVFMTVLARMGVPGLLLWLGLLSIFGISLVAAYARARSVGAAEWAGVDLWILAYWIAFLVNGSFDVVLEGPQGGIWFWCIMGVGLAALEAQRTMLPRVRGEQAARVQTLAPQ